MPLFRTPAFARSMVSSWYSIRSLQTSSNSLQAWKVGKINHVAIAVPDLEKAVSLYKDVLGARVSNKQALPDHGVYTVFVELGDTKIELLYPLGDASPIQNFLDKNKNGGMHHICIEVRTSQGRRKRVCQVDDIKEAMKDMKAKNIRCLSADPKTGAHGKPVVFLHPKDCDGVLVELEQA